jgi:hypothetical protein
MEEKDTQLSCSSEIADVVLEIIRNAVLSIRLAGYRGDAEYCAIEADHIHNLPDLLRNYRREKLEYYLSLERPDYIERLEKIPGANHHAYEAQWQWQRLEQLLRTKAA